MGNSIEKYGDSIVFLGKTVAAEQEKNCQEACVQQENIHQETRAKQERNQVDSCVNDICVRINSLHNGKCNMVLRMAETSVTNNKAVLDAFLHKVKGIEDEIAGNVEELNSLLSTAKKSNQSPQG